MTASNLFSSFKPGETNPWRAVYQGIDYSGEVIIADTWRPELGQKIPEGDNLDDELVDFLRQLLQEADIEIEWRPTLSELAEKFPSLEEGEIDAAAAEFATMLKKAFAKAKRSIPASGCA